MTRRGTVPPGWKDNPTGGAKRIRLVVLASVGLCVASYLALYQLAKGGLPWEALWRTVDPHD
jgi:hypothetical protein